MELQHDNSLALAVSRFPSCVSGAARTCAQTNRFAASVLLPGNVPAAIDDRPQRGGLVAGFEEPCLLDGRLAVETGVRQHDHKAADWRPGLRLPAGLVWRRPLDRLRAVCARCG